MIYYYRDAKDARCPDCECDELYFSHGWANTAMKVCSYLVECAYCYKYFGVYLQIKGVAVE